MSKKKLEKLGLSDLSEKIVHHAAKGEYPGWDITSYDADGTEIFIEVKSSIGSVVSTVDITANEWEAAQSKQHRAKYHLYFVTEALSKTPHIEILRSPHSYIDSGTLNLVTSVYQLDLRRRPDQD